MSEGLTDEIRESIADFEPDVLLADGFEGAYLGLGVRCSFPTVAVYSFSKMVQILMERDGMEEEDAEEYIDFNVIGAYVGERTPIIVMDGE